MISFRNTKRSETGFNPVAENTTFLLLKIEVHRVRKRIEIVG